MPAVHDPHPPVLEIVCHAPPDRLNEDAWLALGAGPLGEQIIAAAIDGATTRLTPPALQAHLDRQNEPLTPAAFAARFIRDSLARQIGTGRPPALRTLLLEANADLGRALIALFGALTLDALKLPPDVHERLAHDPRLVRLGLPAAVLTLIEYDPRTHTLRYAHAGDTLLLVAYADGRFSVPTAGGASSDSALLRTAALLRDDFPDLPFRELTRHSEVRRHVLHSALYHNYVDEHGLPQRTQGIGVLDGLPELRYFVQTGTVDLEGAIFACAMTDGLLWPASAEEVFSEDGERITALRKERLGSMAGQIAEHGLRGYLKRLRAAEAADPDHERYPRLKTHDDATGVLLRFG